MLDTKNHKCYSETMFGEKSVFERKKQNMNVTIKDGKNTITLTLYNEMLISDLLTENGFSFSMPCGGKQTCGKCRIYATGVLSAPSDWEKALFCKDKTIDKNIRYACMTYVLGDAQINLIQSKATIVTAGALPEIQLNPMGCNYGFAVDIGTTTVAIYGYDLKTGELVCMDSFINPQVSFGADVISRIECSMNGNSGVLQKIVADSIQDSILSLCKKKNIPVQLVDSIVITGNTTMLYLLLNYDVTPLSRAPFLINDYLGERIKPEQCGFTELCSSTVYIPRAMSAFVGSDIACSVLATKGICSDKRVSVLIDIGTNGEMVLSLDNRLLCCSTAAGPAFEGVGITMGVIASSGAVNRVYTEEHKIKFGTIDGKNPVGICGSGLIDALAVFLSVGLIDESGRICTENENTAEYITEYSGSPALFIGDSGIIITQSDIRAAQLAKAAVCAGLLTLLNEANITPAEVDCLMLAGGFGSFINIRSASEIGLIPAELKGKTQAVGNAAGSGASMLLLNKEYRSECSRIALSAEILDLSTSPYFMEKYVNCMMF